MMKLPVRVRENLSKEQRKDLMDKLDASELYKLSPCKVLFFQVGWRVNVKNIKEGHPKNCFGNYLPIGFIGRNYAEVVNRNVTFPENYSSPFIEICDSV